MPELVIILVFKHTCSAGEKAQGRPVSPITFINKFNSSGKVAFLNLLPGLTSLEIQEIRFFFKYSSCVVRLEKLAELKFKKMQKAELSSSRIKIKNFDKIVSQVHRTTTLTFEFYMFPFHQKRLFQFVTSFSLNLHIVASPTTCIPYKMRDALTPSSFVNVTLVVKVKKIDVKNLFTYILISISDMFLYFIQVEQMFPASNLPIHQIVNVCIFSK